MMNFFRIVFPLLLVTASLRAGAQIVNVESRRIQTDTTGWAGSFGGNINLSKKCVVCIFFLRTFQKGIIT